MFFSPCVFLGSLFFALPGSGLYAPRSTIGALFNELSLPRAGRGFWKTESQKRLWIFSRFALIFALFAARAFPRRARSRAEVGCVFCSALGCGRERGELNYEGCCNGELRSTVFGMEFTRDGFAVELGLIRFQLRFM